MTKLSPSLAISIALLGCEAPPAGPAPAETLQAVAPTVSAEPQKSAHIAWTDAIAWRDWDAALRTAKAEQKSICLVVYAEWCPHCKELAPEFAKPALVNAAEQLVMVRQDQDAAAPWLAERLGKYGDYIPRVFFLDPNGNMREDLQSGHPRYPYFYAPMVSDVLLTNMRTASRR